MSEIIKLGKKVKWIAKKEDYTDNTIKSLEVHDHFCKTCDSIIRASKKDLKSVDGQLFFLECPNCKRLFEFFRVERLIKFQE